jgi:hypothetical protein
MRAFADARASASQQIKKREVNKQENEHTKQSRNEAMN